MRVRWNILLLGLCGMFAVVAVSFFCLRENEPSYKGRTLSDWLEDYQRSNSDPLHISEYEFTNAIATIGTNAIPTALEWNAMHSPFWLAGVVRLSSATKGDFIDLIIRRHSEGYRQNDAFLIFGVLGTNALCAMPQLTNRFRTSKELPDVVAAAGLISSLGKPGLDFFIQELERGEPLLQRRAAASALFDFRKTPKDLQPFMPQLLKALQSNDRAAAEVAFILGEAQICPQQVVPALTNVVVASSDLDVRRYAIASLGDFGINATAAVPLLKSIILSTDPDTRRMAEKALQRIEEAIVRDGRD